MTEAPEITGRPAVVVVTEDDALVRMVVVELLNDQGFVTIEAEHAAAALHICESRAAEVDVLFTDIRMPGPMNGLELAHHVREQWPWIFVVIVSANLPVARDELPKGARFLPKPFNAPQVLELIQEMSRRP